MTARTRKPRKKATTDVGRSIMQRERQRLAREQAELAEKLAQDAKAASKARKRTGKSNLQARVEASFERSIVRRVAAVLSSEGINVPIETEVRSHGSSINAWTDFNRIHLGYHMFDDIMLTAAVFRGMAYHEGGHCRHTLPFPDLLTLARKEAYGETIADDAFVASKVGTQSTNRQLHAAWNALEDQRMETAVVSDSPRKAGYFTPMMLAELASDPDKAAANWPLMVWRKYLPKHVRDGAKHMFVITLENQGIDSETLVRQIQGITTRYVLAQNATQMFDAVIEMADVLTKIQLDYDITDAGHGRQRSKGTPDPDDLNIPIDPSMEDEDKEEQAEPTSGAGKPKDSKPAEEEEPTNGGGAASEEEDESDDEAEGSGDDEAESDDEAPGETDDEGGSSGTHESDDQGLTQEDLDKAIKDAEDQRSKDSALNSDVKAFNEAMNDASSSLPIYQGGVNQSAEDNLVANTLASDLERSFQMATANVAPQWHEQQRRGVLNVLRYETRQPGDVEFFRSYVDDGEPGTDIAVSVLLDYSGSMLNVTTELAQVAFASKAACDRLGIPCTVVLWDSEARVLWDASERAERLPTISATGGTNPRIALNDLDNQTYGKSKHLVLIMTDDAWNSSAPMLSSYRQEGRTIIGLGYSGGYSSPAIQQSLESRGADFAYSIQKLDEIPRHLEQALINMV